MNRYRVPVYHKELFDDDMPKTGGEIFKIIFGSSATDSIESASRIKGKIERYIQYIDTSKLVNYCKKKDWMHEYPNNKHVNLINDIKKNGIKVPLVVSTIDFKSYEVSEGHHRAGAANLLKIKTVPVFILQLIRGE